MTVWGMAAAGSAGYSGRRRAGTVVSTSRREQMGIECNEISKDKRRGAVSQRGDRAG